MRKILIILLVLILLPIVSATRWVEYDAYESIIQQDGTTIYTGNPVSDFDVLGFECLNDDCSQLGQEVLFYETVSDNDIVLLYPTWLLSEGYAIYFYKDGYIPYEHHSQFWGIGEWWFESEANPYGPLNIYFAKKEGCSTPIEDLEIINTGYPNMPVMIDVQTDVDSTSYSAINHAGPLEAVPVELQDYYIIETQVNLEVRNSVGELIYVDSQIINMDFSGSFNTHFEWIPEEGGEYSIAVSTDVLDEMCDQTTKQFRSSSSQITIIEDPATLEGACYTILNNLIVSDQASELQVAASKISNFMDSVGDLQPVTTEVTLDIFDSDNNNIFTEVLNLGANLDELVTMPFEFLVDGMFYQDGNFVRLTGVSDDPLCTGPINIPSVISTGISVSGNTLPWIAAIEDITVELGETPENIDVNYGDINGDSLTVGLEQSNSDVIDCSFLSDQVVCGEGLEVGDNLITLRVSDGIDEVSEEFNIHVFEDSDVKTGDFEKKHKFVVGSAIVEPMDGQVLVYLRNIGQKNEKNINVRIELLELGYVNQISGISLGSHGSKWVAVDMMDLDNGEYLMKIIVENRYYSNYRYVPIEVNRGEILVL